LIYRFRVVIAHHAAQGLIRRQFTVRVVSDARCRSDVATGLLDDLLGLSPWEKLFGQVGAACLAYWAGVRILGVAGVTTHGWWSLPLTVLWWWAARMAFNLIDGVGWTRHRPSACSRR